MAHPTVTVVTPTKTRIGLLCQAMDSVRSQNLDSWEHLIVDDGSNDDTAEEVGRRAASDARVRYIVRSGDRVGANVCRNIGVNEGRAELVVFLDSDDLLAPDCLARRVRCMQRNVDLDFAVFQASVFEKMPGDLRREMNPEMLGDDLARFLYFEPPWIITGPIWRREALLRLGSFDESLPSWQDIELHIRAICAGARYVRFPEIDHHIRWQFDTTKTSIEQRRSPSHLEAANGIIEKFEQLVRSGPGMNWTRQRALCSLYYFVAERWVEAGNMAAALACWRRVRERQLASAALHLQGALLLRIESTGAPGRRLGGRIAHKWKGLMRMRSEPELVRR